MSPDIGHIPQVERSGYAPWRKRTLVAAGFDPALAARLAVDARLDLHAVLELVDAGCPPHLAARILAPLDGEAGTA
jgi:hypothetical protein